MDTLLSVSVAILAGLLMTRLSRLAKLPAVTAYLVSGVLIGPYFLGAVGLDHVGFHSFDEVEALSLASDIALGFIAFSIGSEFRLQDLKAIGRQATVVGVFQALVATAFVDIALLVFHMLRPDILSVAQVLTLGAIATATAPAATLMVVREFKAKGPLTSILLPIVALDDAVGLVVFAVSFGIAKTLVVGNLDMISILVNPMVEIAASLALGTAMGWILTQIERLFNSNTNRLNMTIAFVFLTVALSMAEFKLGPVTVSFSSLLVCMMLGTVFCNCCPLSGDLMYLADKWSSPLLALFFVLCGAELDLGVFASGSIVLIGVVYIIFRSAGKYIGARVSAKATRCSPEICKYLGVTLLPQAGVALGMCTTAMQLGAQGALIRNITLFAVLIYELVGPLMTKMALQAAGDIQPMHEDVKNRRKHKLEAVGQDQPEREDKKPPRTFRMTAVKQIRASRQRAAHQN